MKKREKMELRRERLIEYAKSGEYADSTSIEIKLRSEFPSIKMSRFERQELDEMCRQAQDGQPGSDG